MPAVDLVLGGECTSECGPDTKNIEESCGDPRRRQILGLRPGLFERKRVERLTDNGGDRFEDLLFGDPIQVVRRRDTQERLRIVVRVARAGWPAFADRHQPVVLVEWQPSKDDSVDNREDRGTGADAEREHDQRDDGEARCRTKLADRLSQIGHEASQEESTRSR